MTFHVPPLQIMYVIRINGRNHTFNEEVGRIYPFKFDFTCEPGVFRGACKIHLQPKAIVGEDILEHLIRLCVDKQKLSGVKGTFYRYQDQ